MKSYRALAALAATAISLAAVDVRADCCQGDANKGYCPIVALDNAKALKLSGKQKADLEKIKSQVMQEMESLKNRVNADVEAVLTDKQEKAYKELPAQCPMAQKGEKCKDCCNGDGECAEKK